MDLFNSSSPVRKPPAASVRSSLRTPAPTVAATATAGSAGTDESTWDSLVAGASSATKRMSQMFEDATNSRENTVMDKLKTWWEDASDFVEGATSSVGEKIAELQTPAPMPDDPLASVRTQVTEYHEALEILKTETLNFSLLIDSLRRPGLGVSTEKSPTMLSTGEPTVAAQFAALVDVQKEFAGSDEIGNVRRGVERLMEELGEEQQKLESIRQRFRRRDKLHGNINDATNKISKKKDKHRAAVAVSPDPKIMQEIFELNTQLDELKKEMRVATKAIVERANEILTRRAKRFQEMLAKFVTLQKQGFERTAVLGQSLGRVADKIAANKAPISPAFALPRDEDHDGDDEDEDEEQQLTALKDVDATALQEPKTVTRRPR